MARDLFTANGPAIVAEFNGGESDLDELALSRIEQPALLVTAADSPDPFRRVSERLTHCGEVRVPGGHMIDPAHPAVICFIERAIAGERAPPRHS